MASTQCQRHQQLHCQHYQQLHRQQQHQNRNSSSAMQQWQSASGTCISGQGDSGAVRGPARTCAPPRPLRPKLRKA